MPAEPDFAADSSRAISRSLTRSYAVHVGGRIVEALALGWLAAAIVLAAISLTSGSSAVTSSAAVSKQALFVALLSGCLAAASAWFEHVPKPRENLRRIDRRLAFGGALVTASDVADDALPGPIAQSLVRDVASRLRGADLARASLPNTPLAIVAVILGLAVVFGARDLASERRRLDTAHSVARTASADQAMLTAAARALASESVDTPESAGAVLAEQRALARDLEAAANAVSLEAGARSDLARRLKLALAEQSLEPSKQDAVAAAAALLETAQVANTGTGAANSSEKTGTESDSSAAALASGESLGKMSGPDPRTSGSNSGSTPEIESARAEQGVGSIRWWPARHDAVVEAWLASAPRHK